jgi:hypothetical protein
MRPLTVTLACALATGLACGDPNAVSPPSADWEGIWSITTSPLDVGGALEGTPEPTPFLLTIILNGALISDTFPTITWMSSGGTFSFPYGQASNAIAAHADTLLWRIFSVPDGTGKYCALVYSGALVAPDSARGSVLVSGTNTLCAAANGGTWVGKRQ